MKIAVAGGTGVVGAVTVTRLKMAGHEPVVLSRGTGTDLVSGTGLAEKLDGVDAIIDVTSTATTSARAATDFFTTTTGNLLSAGAAAGVRHHLLLSIVGIDVTPFGYYIGKVAQEQLVSGSSVPWTIVRAPQFHEFAEQLVSRGSFAGMTVVPGMLSAPMSAREVAAVLVDLAEGPPQGYAAEIGGPQPEKMTSMVRRLLRHQGSRRLVLPLRVPGKAGAAMRGGALVPKDPGVVGFQTFDAWLEEKS
ncbi:MAG: NAD(P)H-binding protein [Propionibacteriales bacterium]|nr:NAD(P)H-binding protein [Propionibacteriales bacterium]